MKGRSLKTDTGQVCQRCTKNPALHEEAQGQQASGSCVPHILRLQCDASAALVRIALHANAFVKIMGEKELPLKETLITSLCSEMGPATNESSNVEGGVNKDNSGG